MNKQLALAAAVAAAAALSATPAFADDYPLETFTNAPLSNAGYGVGQTITNTGLQVTAGAAVIGTGDGTHGNILNIYSGWYSPNFDAAGSGTGYSTVSSLATFDLIAGYTYTLSYDYSRGFGAGGNGPFPTSLIASLGSHSISYTDVTGFYYGQDWAAGTLTFVAGATELGAHVSFTALGAAGYSSMAVDNISMIGLAPTTGGGGGDIPGGGGTVPAVPEPETYALMLAGLGALAFVARRRRSAQAA